MAYEKILILESSWADEREDYISDSRSTARIYLSFETLLSLHRVPVFAIHRPLLAGRYLKGIRQFVSLPANATQMNIVILSAHGTYTRVQKGDKKVNRRRLHAIDGQIRLSSDIHKLKGQLDRTGALPPLVPVRECRRQCSYGLTSLRIKISRPIAPNISVQLHQFQSNYSPKQTVSRVDFGKLEA